MATSTLKSVLIEKRNVRDRERKSVIIAFQLLTNLRDEEGIYRGKDNDYLSDRRPDFVGLIRYQPMTPENVRLLPCLSDDDHKCLTTLINACPHLL